MKVIIREPKLLIHIPMHFKKTIQFKTVKVNIKETTTKRASDSQQHQTMPRYQSRRIHAPPSIMPLEAPFNPLGTADTSYIKKEKNCCTDLINDGTFRSL